jgi:hypothetical protein
MDHPHYELVDVTATFHFPNIEFETDKINFGCILNHTSKRITISVKNISVMSVFYEWKFAEPTEKRDIKAFKNIAINEVFDILPLNGTLEAGEVEEVEFIFNSYSN